MASTPTLLVALTAGLVILVLSALPSAALQLKSEIFYSPTFEMAPGEVTFKYFYGVDFPKGHLALKQFRVDVVDAEDDHVIPYHEVYLHHSSMSRYYQATNYSIPPLLEQDTFPYGDGFISLRNHGLCQGDILGQYVGIGTETLSTTTNVPDPYGMEIGNPDLIPDGFQEKWLLAVHTIDTRGTVDRFGCTECRRDLYNVSVDPLGEPLKPNYHGGLSCCYAHTKCKVRDDYHGPTRRIRMRYTLTWTDWIPSIVPVRVYILDATDEMKLHVDPSNGAVTAHHDCKVEYDVERCNIGEEKVSEEECVDFKRSIVAIPKGGNLILGVTHLHSGAINSTLYGQDGRVLCRTEPIYGEGDEEGYVVGMSTCYPEPGFVVINDGELVVHESVYNATRRRTGVMALFHLLIADPQPENTASSSFSRLTFLMSDKLSVRGITFPEGGVLTGALLGVGGIIILAAVVVVVVQLGKNYLRTDMII